MDVKHAVSGGAVPEQAAAGTHGAVWPVSLLKAQSCSHLPWSFLKQDESVSFQGLFYMDSYGNNAAASSFLSQKELFGKKSLGNLVSLHDSHSYEEWLDIIRNIFLIEYVNKSPMDNLRR